MLPPTWPLVCPCIKLQRFHGTRLRRTEDALLLVQFFQRLHATFHFPDLFRQNRHWPHWRRLFHWRLPRFRGVPGVVSACSACSAACAAVRAASSRWLWTLSSAASASLSRASASASASRFLRFLCRAASAPASIRLMISSSGDSSAAATPLCLLSAISRAYWAAFFPAVRSVRAAGHPAR